MQILWSLPARKDLHDIYNFIAEDNVDIAWKFHEHLKDKVNSLSKHPQVGRPGRIHETRELTLSNHPYIIVYRVKNNAIEIMAIYHTSRKWPENF